MPNNHAATSDPTAREVPQPPAPFVAEVEYDAEAGVWTASCEALGVFTEAESYDALEARFWAIAPEIAEENHIPFPDSSRVEFRHLSHQPTRAH